MFDNGPINVDFHVYKITDLYNTYFDNYISQLFLPTDKE